MRQSMTYGTLPSYAEFERAWEGEQEAGELGEQYHITLGSHEALAADGTSIGDGSYSCEDLYSGLVELVDLGTDESLDLAAGILFTLGLEWI